MIDLIQTLRNKCINTSSLNSVVKWNWGLTPEGTQYPYANINVIGSNSDKAFKDNSGAIIFDEILKQVV